MIRNASTSRRIAILLLVALSVIAAVAPAGVAAAGAADSTATSTPALVQNETAPENGTDGGGDSFYEEDSDDGPTIASQARITPIQTDEDWMRIEVRTSDEAYDTSGPFATFEVSEDVDAVRIEQPNAEATVIGDSVVRVQYAPEAGADDQESLYQLELFFADDSSTTIDLYASETDVSVEAARYSEYSDFIDYVEGQAESEGYEATPEGLRSYVEDKEEIADILNTLLSGHAKEFFALLTAAAFNPFTWIIGTGTIVAYLLWTLYKHGWVLKMLQRARSEAEILRESIRQRHERDKQAAASHDLDDVDDIGPNSARYWSQIDVNTVGHMIQVVCKGVVDVDERGRIVRDADGNPQMLHHGVEDLLAVEPLTEEQLRSNTWLQPLLYDGRLSARTALSNIRAALLVAENEYGLGPEVRPTRKRVEQLLDDVKGRHEAPTPNNEPSSGSHAAAGGDD